MDSHAAFVVVRLVHVVAGAFWVGAAVFLAAFLLPSILASGPAGGSVMRHLTQVRRFPVVLLWATWLTLLSGGLLYWRLSGGLHPAWLTSGPGMTFGVGGLLGLGAAVLGIGVSAPAAKRLGALGAAIAAGGGPPTPEQGAEIGRLQARMKAAAIGVASLLVVATVAMAVARYV